MQYMSTCIIIVYTLIIISKLYAWMTEEVRYYTWFNICFSTFFITIQYRPTHLIVTTVTTVLFDLNVLFIFTCCTVRVIACNLYLIPCSILLSALRRLSAAAKPKGK